MAKQKVMDLVPTEDGSYAPQGHTASVPAKIKKKVETKKEAKPKYKLGKNADQFFAGMDVGFELLDEIGTRVEKFLKMRG